MVARLKNGKLLALDYREMAPIHADRDMYLDEKGNPQTGKSLDGHLASGVPAAVSHRICREVGGVHDRDRPAQGVARRGGVGRARAAAGRGSRASGPTATRAAVVFRAALHPAGLGHRRRPRLGCLVGAAARRRGRDCAGRAGEALDTGAAP